MWYLELKRVEKMVSHARNQIYTRAKQERNEEREIIGEREKRSDWMRSYFVETID